ncbi:MAG TPA: hypothetical protein VMD02_06175, partial [Candidatus Omnitrophota bacterium]|nr:hypothetical protein [Candidatus Omnitrophota bacterium]
PVVPPPVVPPPVVTPTKPVEPPPPPEPPVSDETKEKGKKAIARANSTIAKLNTVGGTSQGQISRAMDDAKEAMKGNSDKEAKQAIDKLNSASARGDAEYKKIREGL